MRSRRKTLAAISAIMGRLGKSLQNTTRPIFKVHYRKLDDECNQNQQQRQQQQHQEQLRCMSALPEYMSYCCCQCGHTQKLKPEELNAIVGNAFRMAYVALQRQPILQNKQLEDDSMSNGNTGGVGGGCRIPLSISWLKSQTPLTPTSRIESGSLAADMNVQVDSAGSPTLRLVSVKPTSIPDLRPVHNFPNILGPFTNANEPKSTSQQNSPSSNESNSPTELNSCKRLTDKPPLIKRLAMGLTGGRDFIGFTGVEDSCPLVNDNSRNKSHSGGYVNEAIIDSEGSKSSYNKLAPSESIDNSINASITEKNFCTENERVEPNSPGSETETEIRLKKNKSQLSPSVSGPVDGILHRVTSTPPPLPERTDSLNNRSEESELRKAPWFQAGIPREITLEVLNQEPEGAFMVRESTSKPGCFALSLRVPREFQPSGIAHYLILRTNKGYKIKGFKKEFSSLPALITHHSVMPELLPCPLSLSRYNPNLANSSSNKDFADIDLDPDYNSLADFRKTMANLSV